MASLIAFSPPGPKRCKCFCHACLRCVLFSPASAPVGDAIHSSFILFSTSQTSRASIWLVSLCGLRASQRARSSSACSKSNGTGAGRDAGADAGTGRGRSGSISVVVGIGSPRRPSENSGPTRACSEATPRGGVASNAGAPGAAPRATAEEAPAAPRGSGSTGTPLARSEAARRDGTISHLAL